MKKMIRSEKGHCSFNCRMLLFAFMFIQNIGAQDVKAKLDNLLGGFPQKGPGGVVIVLENSNLIYSGTYGLASMEWNIPNRTDIVYRIGSLTKTFTAFAILQLDEDKKLSIQDPVKKWLPEVEIDGRINIGHLLSHTSGIQEGKKELAFTPGERMNYSNHGYILLGQIIAKCSGLPYDKYVKKYIFNLLGMQNSGYEHPGDIIKNKASGYRLEKSGAIPAPCIDMDGPGAAGGLYSTAMDLVNFEKALSGDKGISKSILLTSFTPYKLNDSKESSYGMGWMTRNYKGWNEVSHGGDIEGFNCYFAHFPDQKRSVVVLQNCKMQIGAPWSESGMLVNIIVEALWGKELQKKPQEVAGINVPEEKLKLLAGVYEFENAPKEMLAIMGSTQTFTVENGSLVIKNKVGKAPILATSETEFAAQGVDLKFRFYKNAEGKFTELICVLMGIREIKAKRIE